MATQDTIYNGNENSCCKLIEVALDQIPQVKYSTSGALEALRASTQAFSGRIDITAGGSRPNGTGQRKIYTKATVPVCTDTTPTFDICDKANFGASTTNPEKWVEHTIDLSISREFVFTNEEYREFCSNTAEVYARLINAHRSGVQTEISNKIIQELKAYMGAYAYQTAPDNSIATPLDINLFNDLAQGYSGYALIKDQYAKLGYTMDTPIILGGSSVAVSMDANRRGVGYNQAGYAPDMLPPSSYIDYGVNTAFGDTLDHLLTFIPGTFILAQWNDVTPQFASDSRLKGNEASILFSPFGDGLNWDFQKLLSDNACQHVIRMKAHFGVLCPVPYNECALKPALHFQANCTPNPCVSTLP